MSNLIQTIPGQDFSLVNDRCLSHPGCIVDIGCLGWDWSKFFIGKKRVIGVDPFEDAIDQTEIFKGCIYNFNGVMKLTNNDIATSMFGGGNTLVGVITWKSFLMSFGIDSISVLKINIEGAEYELLKSMTSEDFKMIDQIAISFHDWLNPEWETDTKDCLKYLKKNDFEIKQIFPQWGWYLATKRYE
jgi:hypothetical protein